jgi:protein gp37
MGDKTGIEWTDTTWNVVRGCRRVSDGCRLCYAEKVAHRFCGANQPYEGLTVEGKARWNGEVRFEADHLLDPLRWDKPRRIFVNSMSDVFYEPFTNEQIAAQFAVMAIASTHQYQVLTKRPTRMVEWLDWIKGTGDVGATLRASLKALLPDGVLDKRRSTTTQRLKRGLGLLSVMDSLACEDTGDALWPLRNVLLGVSVENQQAADERIPLLTSIDKRWQVFLSCEPLLGPVSLKRWLPEEGPELDWVIVGGESGDREARAMYPSWVRTLRDECKGAGVPFFFKQWGDYAPDQSVGKEEGAHFAYLGEYTGNKKANGAMLDGVEHKEWPRWTMQVTAHEGQQTDEQQTTQG